MNHVCLYVSCFEIRKCVFLLYFFLLLLLNQQNKICSTVYFVREMCGFFDRLNAHSNCVCVLFDFLFLFFGKKAMCVCKLLTQNASKREIKTKRDSIELLGSAKQRLEHIISVTQFHNKDGFVDLVAIQTVSNRFILNIVNKNRLQVAHIKEKDGIVARTPQSECIEHSDHVCGTHTNKHIHIHTPRDRQT